MSKIYNNQRELMFQDNELTLAELVLKNKKNLQKADLKNADLSNADLASADLRGADLSNANLISANLSYANLSYANLRGANLSRANLRNTSLGYTVFTDTNLRNADLSDTNLRGVNLSGADLKDTQINYQLEPGLIQKVAQHALATESSLEMEDWHSCDSTHCIAGWACHLAKNGEELEANFNPQIAGLLLLGAEAHSHFFDDNEKAREYLKSVL